MNTLVTNKRMLAALVVSFLAAGVIGGASMASAHFGARGPFDEESRELLKEVHELVREGEYEEAEELIEASNLSEEQKERILNWIEKHGSRHAIRAAVESGDYEAFVALTADAPFADLVDEEFFEALQEAHELREAGDRKGAREALSETGIERQDFKGGFPGMMHGQKRGFHNK